MVKGRRNMAHPWAMTSASCAVRVVSVVVQIWMDTTHPPTGRVVLVGGEAAQSFTGWLQLLTILTNAVEPPQASRTLPAETSRAFPRTT